MKFTRVKEEAGRKQYYFETFTRPDFIEAALVVTTDENSRVSRLFFNSNDLGTAELDAKEGPVACNSWETEDAAMNPEAGGSRWFPVILHNGSENGEYAKSIMTRVLTRIDDDALSSMVEDFTRRDGEVVFDPDSFR